MKCEIRTLALTKRVAKALPHKDFSHEYIPNIVGYVLPQAMGRQYWQKFVLVQLVDSAFWCSVSYAAPKELGLDEITLY